MRQTQPSNGTGVSVHLVGSDNPQDSAMDRVIRGAITQEVGALSITRASSVNTKGQNTMAVNKPKKATGSASAKPTKTTKAATPKKEKVPMQKAKDFKSYAEYCEYRAGLFQEKVDAWKQKGEDFRTGKLGKNKKVQRFQKMQAKLKELEDEIREAGLDPEKLEAISE